MPALLLTVLLGCSTESCAGAPARPTSDSIDFVLPGGQRSTLSSLRGKVVVVDVCASWASACNLNARVLDDVAAALAGQPVEVITVLLDEGPLAAEAQRSYREVLGVQHLVTLAGSRVLAGTSVLGDPREVPRLLIVDRDGNVVVDETGGIVGVTGIVERVKGLL